jgi:flagellum-specific peptidoglycan hydrolase FlgJ
VRQGVDCRTGGASLFRTINSKLHAFRAYDSLAATADDYANVISTNKLFATVYANRTDPIKYAESMGKSPYATGAAYGELMKQIIHDHNLTQYDK